MRSRRLLFISKGEDSSSTRYRARAYFSRLQSAGWEPVHATAHRNPLVRLALLEQARRAHTVIVLRKTFGGAFLALLRAAARRLVFDFDDAVFVRSNGEASDLRMRRFTRMLSRCDEVWAGNHYLAENAAGLNPNVVVLPTSIDPDRYRVPGARTPGCFDLVWIGSRSTRRYLLDVLPVLEDCVAEVPELRLRIIADFTLPSQRLPVLASPWDGATEAAELAAAHAGIAPLTDNPWTRGKCGLKVLQYMAAGLPVISSDTGVNHDLVREGETGFLVRDPDAWQAAIRRLARDPALCDSLGDAGRRRCWEQYSIDATFARLQARLDIL